MQIWRHDDAADVTEASYEQLLHWESDAKTKLLRIETLYQGIHTVHVILQSDEVDKNNKIIETKYNLEGVLRDHAAQASQYKLETDRLLKLLLPAEREACIDILNRKRKANETRDKSRRRIAAADNLRSPTKGLSPRLMSSRSISHHSVTEHVDEQEYDYNDRELKERQRREQAEKVTDQ